MGEILIVLSHRRFRSLKCMPRTFGKQQRYLLKLAPADDPDTELDHKYVDHWGPSIADVCLNVLLEDSKPKGVRG